MTIDPPVGKASPKSCRAALRGSFESLVRDAAMAGWPTPMTAQALSELAHELGERANDYQRFGIMSEPDERQ